MSEPQSSSKIARTFDFTLDEARRTFGELLPGVAAARALALFARPTPLPARLPEVPGHAARRFTLVDGDHHLAAWEWGEGPTVLLVHGWNGIAAQLSAFVAPLVESGHHVVAFDQPAHGASSGETATLVAFRDAVAAFGSRLAPLHAVVAHSLGAAATALALADGLRVGRVALLAPPSNPEHYARLHAERLGMGAAATAAFLERIEESVGTELDRLDLRTRARALTAPALVLHDRGDREVPFDHGRAVADAWPGARFVPLEGLGHRRMLEAPAIVSAVVDFVTHSSPRRTA